MRLKAVLKSLKNAYFYYSDGLIKTWFKIALIWGVFFTWKYSSVATLSQSEFLQNREIILNILKTRNVRTGVRLVAISIYGRIGRFFFF